MSQIADNFTPNVVFSDEASSNSSRPLNQRGFRFSRLTTGIVLVGGALTIAIAAADRIGIEKVIPSLAMDPSYAHPTQIYLDAVANGVFAAEGEDAEASAR